jgi:hypothetical protein
MRTEEAHNHAHHRCLTILVLTSVAEPEPVEPHLFAGAGFFGPAPEPGM